MDKIEVEKAELTEVEQLQIISKQTFFESFADWNTKENMQMYLDEGFTIDKLNIELANPNSEFYFAKLNNKIIGYLKINFGQAQTDLKDNNALEIERIYVFKEFHGKQVGQILYETALNIAKQTNADYLWLGVWEKNPRAISFYKKNGFIEFDKHIFKLGDDDQMDIMMKLNLSSTNFKNKDIH